MFGLFEAPVDSSERAQVRQVITASLIRAVREMAAAAGPDLAKWRLEEFRRGRRYFPVWSYDSVKDQLPALNQSRYAPIEIPQRGHVTTLAWQPSLDQNPLGSPSHVVVWGQAGRTTSMAMRPDYQIGTGFIARHIAGPPKSAPIVTESAPESAIVLLPKPD